jgi:hypothetical protein
MFIQPILAKRCDERQYGSIEGEKIGEATFGGVNFSSGNYIQI